MTVILTVHYRNNNTAVRRRYPNAVEARRALLVEAARLRGSIPGGNTGTITTEAGVTADYTIRGVTMEKKAIVLRHNGTAEQIVLDKDGAVGGWIEAVSPDTITTLWFNEEGKLKGLPRNNIATRLWWLLNPEAAGVDVLCGDVVVTGGVDDEGDTNGIADVTASLINEIGDL